MVIQGNISRRAYVRIDRGIHLTSMRIECNTGQKVPQGTRHRAQRLGSRTITNPAL